MKQTSSLGIQGESEFLRRSNSRRLGRRKRIRRFTLRGGHVALVTVVLILLALLIYRAAQFLLSWERLDIRTVRLVNRPTQGMDRVRALLESIHGNILSLSLDYLRGELSDLNQVRDVSVSRVLPSTLEITFQLRRPAYQIATGGGYLVVDREGVLLVRRPRKQQGLLTLKGISLSEFQRIKPYLNHFGSMRDRLDYVGFREPFGLTLKLSGVPEVIYPGSGNIREKVQLYLDLRDQLISKDSAVRVADLRFTDRFYLEFDHEGVR